MLTIRFLFCFISIALATLKKYELLQGSSYRTVIFYSGDRFDARNTFVFSHKADGKLYITEYHGKLELPYEDVLCTSIRTTKIAIGPAACIPEYGIHHRCTTTFSEALELHDKLLDLFDLPVDSNECKLNEGDKKTCLGPLYIFRDEVNHPIKATNETLIRSNGVAKLSTYGYGCGVPAITYLNVKLPRLYLYTTCTDDFNNDFTANYVIHRQDAFNSSDIVDIYQRDDNGRLSQHRIIIRNLNGKYYVQLADLSLDYRVYYTSLTSFNTPNYEYELPIHFETNGSCFFNISINPIKRLELLQLDELNGRNFYQNNLPRFHHITRVCGFVICYLNNNGHLAIPGCPEGEFRGGYPDGAVRLGSIKVPVQIPADESYRHYEIECESFYPWNSEFQVFAGTGNTGESKVRQTRVLCNAPFYYPEGIVNSVSPENEKSLQCFNIGGVLAELSRSYCKRDVKSRKCEQGYVYFNSKCYYKRDSQLETDKAVPLEQSVTACASLGDDVQVLRSPEFELTQWILNRFIGWKAQNPSIPHRVQTESSQCICFNALLGEQQGSAEYCNCQDNYFDICWYPAESRPIPHESIAMSPEAITLFKNGNEGIPWTGAPLTCTCTLGSTGDYCNIGKCLSFLDIQNLAETTESSRFFSKCFFQNRGFCVNGDLNLCQCNERQGPPASLDPGSELFIYEKFPCSCPMAADDKLGEKGFRVNDDFYPGKYAICGGIDRGYCVLENSTLLSRCAPTLRLDLLRRELEPAYNGRANEGRVAIKPADDFYLQTLVTEGFCNGNGIVCSSGELDDHVLLSGQDVSFYHREECVPPFSGCSCFNGLTGDACTCFVPFNRALDKLVYQDSFRNYISFEEDRTIEEVIVTNCQHYQVHVGTRNNPRQHECLYEERNPWFGPNYYNCQGSRGTIVSIKTTNRFESCQLKVYSEPYFIGGYHTNPTAGRFSANEYYRNHQFYLEEQGMNYAPFGCTNTEVMCDNEHSGVYCNISISSKRWNDEKGDFILLFCHEDTFPALGKPLVDLNTVPTTARCDCLKGEDFTFQHSKACQCISAYVPELGKQAMCYHRGICIDPSFPKYTCEFDLIDFEQDPMSGLLQGTYPSSKWRKHTMQEDSIWYILGKAWIFTKGYEILIDSVYEDISHCQYDYPLPISIQYECNDNPPVRAYANVTIATSNVHRYQIWCEPYNTCPTSESCVANNYPCIQELTWTKYPDEDEALESNEYNHVFALCASTNTTVSIFRDIDIRLDASNPVDRIIDDALEIITGTRLFNASIHPYSNVLGELYLFADVVPGIHYSNKHWTDDHYWFISSYLGHVECSLDIYNQEIKNNIITSWIRFTETNTVFVNESNNHTPLQHFFNENSGMLFPNQTLTGSRILRSLFIWPDLIDHSMLAWYGLKGHTVLFPAIVKRDVRITEVKIRSPGELQAIQLITETGKICGTLLRKINENETITFHCPEAFVANDELVQLYQEAPIGTNITEIAQAWFEENPLQHYIRYVVEDHNNNITFKVSDISVSGQNVQTDTFIEQIRQSIFKDKRFPNSTVFEDACIQEDGIISKIASLTNYHKEYLRDFYYTHLSPRNPTHEWQCKTFARNVDYTRLIPSNTKWIRWRNGDPNTYPYKGIGDEGGCECFHNEKQGYYSPIQHCSMCIDGLGPLTLLDWQKTIAYQVAIENTYPLLNQPISFTNQTWKTLDSFSLLQDHVMCRLPWDSQTTRGTGLCGGFGYVDQPNIETISYYRQVFTQADGTRQTRRCTSLLLDNQYSFLLINDTIAIDVITYSNGSNVINVIKERIFYDGQELFMTCQEDTCHNNENMNLECMYSPKPKQNHFITHLLSRTIFSFWYLILT